MTSKASPNLGLLFDCSKCEIHSACGGSDTGPCGCVFLGTPRAYDCNACPLHCRARRVPPNESTFLDEVAAGRPLEVVLPNDREPPELPLVIPTLCDRLDTGTRLKASWIGVQLVSLVTMRKDGSSEPKQWLSRNGLSNAQRVVSSANAIALLHGDDRLLRGFWGMDRLHFYQLLEQAGIRVVTAPPFSVYDDGPRWPASESVMMLLRHNRVLDELYRAGFVAIPNLFWRSLQDQKNWISWLADHPHVTVLNRDFSCTPQPQSYAAELNDLTKIISAVGRRMHVVLQGVSDGKAAQTLEVLKSVGVTCSFVTGHPVLLGRGGRELKLSRDNRLVPRKNRDLGLGELCIRNLQTFERWVLDSVAKTELYCHRDWSNLTG